MKNKKMFLSATAIATVALVGTTTTMAAMNAGNGKDSKEAQAKEAQAKKIKQLAEQKKKEQEKINKALNSITVQEINAEIKKQKDFKDTTPVANYTIPKKVQITKDGIVFDIALTEGKKDSKKGQISWKASISTKNLTQPKDMSGDLSGFQTDAMAKKIVNKKALGKMTEALINAEIEKYYKKKGITKSTSKAKTTSLPATVDVIIDNVTITVTLTKKIGDDSTGEISWDAEGQAGAQTQALNNKKISGFETDAQTNVKNANNAIKSITVQEINDAIDKHFVANNITKADEEASSVAFPGSVVIIGVNGITVTVALTKGAVDNNAGNIAWTTSSITATNGTVTATQLSGTNKGFQTQTKRNQIAANTAINSITVAKINAAIDAHFVANNITKADEEASSVAFPGSVTIGVNGITVTVALTKGAVDNNAGNIAWTTSSITATNGSVTATQLSGTNVGFQTQTKRNQIAANTAINSITVAKINAAIDAHFVANNITKADEEASSVAFPGSVTIDVNGITVTVALTKGAVDNNAGNIAWTTSSITATNGTVTATQLSGTNVGFQTQTKRNQIAANTAINSITVAKINAAIDAHFVANNITKADEEASSVAFPGSVTIDVNGITVTVALTKGAVDNNAGNIAWTTSSITATNGTVTATQLSGTNAGFQTQAKRDEIAANAAVNSITAQQVNDALKAYYKKQNITLADVRTDATPLPAMVTVVVNGLDITLTTTSVSDDNVTGTKNWNAVVSHSLATATKTITGGLVGFQTDAQKLIADTDQAINDVTATDVNNAIIAKLAKQNITIDSTVLPKEFTQMPTEVIVSKNGVDVIVKLLNVTAENDGTFSWDSEMSSANTQTIRTNLSDKLSGFQTLKQRHDEIMAAITVADIQKLVDAEFTRLSVDKTKTMPSEVTWPSATKGLVKTITIRNVTIDVKIIKDTTTDDNSGKFGWKATLSSAETTKTVDLSDTMSGLLTTSARMAQLMRKITNKMISDEILKVIGVVDDTVSLDSINPPKKVVVTLGKVKFDVVLKYTKKKATGSLAWEAKDIIAPNKDSMSNLRHWSINGFETQKLEDTRNKAAINAISEAQINKAIMVKMKKFDGDPYAKLPESVKIKTTRGEFVWNIFVTRDYQKNPNIIRSSKVDLTWRAVVTKKPMTTLKREVFMQNTNFPFNVFTEGATSIEDSLSLSKKSVKVENGKVGISIDLTDFFGGPGEDYGDWINLINGINDAITKKVALAKGVHEQKPILLQTTGVKKTFFVDVSKNGTTTLVNHMIVGTNAAKASFKFSVVISNYNKTTNTADIEIKVDIVNRSASTTLNGKDFGGILINSIGIIAGSNEGSLVTKEGTLMKGASPASPVQSIYKITK